MTKEFNKKRLIIRIALVAALILLCFGLYYIGKEHEVLLDNKTVTIAGKEYAEIPYCTVTINGDGDKEMEFYAGDRDVAQLQGAHHKILIKVIDEKTEKVEKTVERTINLGTVSNVMYSLPALVGGAENAELTVPTAQQVAQEEAHEEAKEEAAKEGLSESPVDKSIQQIDSNKTIEGPTTTE